MVRGLRFGSRLTRLVFVMLVAAVVAVSAVAAASASPVTGSDANGTYLALGDSVAFGYVPPTAVSPPNYFDAHSFVGYPEYLAQLLNEHVANASCPGETSTSLLTGAHSNGCEDSIDSSPSYRSLFPLHVQYQGTQMDYALKYLADHKHTHLITIDIGANDFFICVAKAGPAYCTTSGATRLVGLIIRNLAVTYSELHNAAPNATIVLLTYYSYNPLLDSATEQLDAAIAAASPSYVKVADGYNAFLTVENNLGYPDDPCGAGLLIKVPVPGGGTTCDVHPTALGQQTLAEAIADVPGVQP